MSAINTTNLLLIGFMGTGKTTISHTLATLLQLPEVDIDQLIEVRAGKPISAIFADDGEAAFRLLETAILQELAGGDAAIISCGGGLAMQPQNLPIMKQAGRVVLLTATAETVLERVKHATHRPLLQGRMSVAGIAELMDVRRERYAACADITVATDHKTVDAICQEIIASL